MTGRYEIIGSVEIEPKHVVAMEPESMAKLYVVEMLKRDPVARKLLRDHTSWIGARGMENAVVVARRLAIIGTESMSVCICAFE